MNDELRRLLAQKEIEAQINRYARACDERDWAAWDRIFLADVTADFGPAFPPVRGAAELTGILRSILEKSGPTQHLTGNISISLTNEDEADSRFYIRGFHSGTGERAGRIWDAMGEYQDRWRKGPEGWRITQRRWVQAAQVGTLEELIG